MLHAYKYTAYDAAPANTAARVTLTPSLIISLELFIFTLVVFPASLLLFQGLFKQRREQSQVLRTQTNRTAIKTNQHDTLHQV